jgi:hypothetical protein
LGTAVVEFVESGETVYKIVGERGRRQSVRLCRFLKCGNCDSETNYKNCRREDVTRFDTMKK